MSERDSDKHNHPATPWMGRPLSLKQLQRIKNWHAVSRALHPVENVVWEAVMTAWLLGWTAWLPAAILEAPWAYPLCLMGILLPQLYVQLRATAHRRGKLRCEWLGLLV